MAYTDSKIMCDKQTNTVVLISEMHRNKPSIISCFALLIS